MIRLRFSLACLLLLILSFPSQAGSLYLPVHLSPEIEARIERLFVIADMPIIKRPIPVKQVQVAMTKAARRDPALVSSVRAYIERYSHSAAITHLNLSASVSSGTAQPLPNERGFDSRSNYNLSTAAYWVLNDYVAFNLGGMAAERDNGLKDEFAEGSFLSLGPDALQIDIGLRPHWFSPFQNSAMLISTQASALPGITLSNVAPFDFLGIRYEMFLAQMSKSDAILSAERDERLKGNPLLYGVHLSFEPVEGFAIGFNRLMQYGGADREQSPSALADAFFNVKANDNIGLEGRDFGNQLSAINTRYTFGSKFPVSVYMEYAGEDTSKSSDVHLGNSAYMLGLHLPQVGRHFDFSYEYSDRQNGWYVNTNYGDGLTHFGSVLGHWSATQGIFSDALSAQTHMAKLVWDIKNGSSLTTVYRSVNNDSFSSSRYEQAQEISLEYAQALGGLIAGAKVIHGQNIFGEDYSQLTGFIRW